MSIGSSKYRLHYLGIIVVFFPSIVGWMYQDETNRYRETRQGAIIGGGSFMYFPFCLFEDCGSQRITYFEIGYQWEQKTPGWIRWGITVQGGGVSGESQSAAFVIVQPRLALDTRYFLIGAGLGIIGGGVNGSSGVLPLPALNLRLGPENIVYLYGGLLDGAPLLTQGWLNCGIGFRTGSTTRFRLGTNAGPFSWAGVVAGIEQFLSDGKQVLTIEGRFGREQETGLGEPEFGLGLKYMSRQVEIIPKTSVGVPAPQPPSPVAQEEPDLALLLSALPPILFDTGQATLSQNADALVETYAAVLSLVPMATVMVEGHCDERGSTEYNESLGEGRAMSVVRALHSRGVPTERLRVESKGDSQPVDEGHTEEAWARNRRVVLVLAR